MPVFFLAVNANMLISEKINIKKFVNNMKKFHLNVTKNLILWSSIL